MDVILYFNQATVAATWFASKVSLTFTGRFTIISSYICTTPALRRRRWAGVVKMLCKCFVFAGYITLLIALFFVVSPHKMFMEIFTRSFSILGFLGEIF